MTIHETIKAAREAINMTQQQLADEVFATQQAVSKWERGIATPSIESCMLLSKILNIDFISIIGRKAMNYNMKKMDINKLDTISKLEDVSASILDENAVASKYGYTVNLLCKWSLIFIIGDLWQNNHRSIDEFLEWWDVSDALKEFLKCNTNIEHWCEDIREFISLASSDENYNDHHDSLKLIMSKLNEEEKQRLATAYDLENFDLLKYCEELEKYAAALERSIVMTSDVYAKMRVALNELIMYLDSDKPDNYVSSYTT